jgi:hypothetical protein
MAWYAAHIILFFRLKKGNQKRFPIWENIVLIHAQSEEEAFAKAEELGRQDAGDDDGSLRINEEPAELVFAGVRKLVLCQDQDRRPTDGTEVSYNEMEVRSEEAIHKLVAGEPVSVTIADVFPDSDLRQTPQPVGVSRAARGE